MEVSSRKKSNLKEVYNVQNPCANQY